MARGFYLTNEDIDIHISEEELTNMGLLEIKDKKLRHKPLEVQLEDKHKEAKENLRAIVQIAVKDFKGYDGVNLTKKDYEFLIEISDDVYWKIYDNGIFGTRYNGESKIQFFLDK